MTDIPAFHDLHFHDSSLDEIHVEGSTVRMRFESVSYPPLETEQDDYPLVSLTLWVDGVERIVQDDKVVHTLAIQGSYGGVIALDREGQEIVIALSWTYFGPGARDEFSQISLSGPDLVVRCGPYAYQVPEAR